MENASSIKEHMAVVGADGEHVGTVDHMDGSDKIRLTRTDASAAGKHHVIPLAWVERVDDKIVLKTSGNEAMSSWQTID